MLRCVEETGGRYNYTIISPRTLLVQPHEIRELHDVPNSPDKRLTVCINVIGRRFVIWLTSNTWMEDDMVGSLPFDTSNYQAIVDARPDKFIKRPSNGLVTNGSIVTKRTGYYNVLLDLDLEPDFSLPRSQSEVGRENLSFTQIWTLK